MKTNKTLTYLTEVIANIPNDWLGLTTHRLDIYEEEQAKTQFLEGFEALYNDNSATTAALSELPTAYDYIRLGHPLSCVLEWAIAKLNGVEPQNVIAFSSETIAILAILRKNSLDGKNTRIVYTGALPDFFDPEVLRSVYGYRFELKRLEETAEVPVFDGSTILFSLLEDFSAVDLSLKVDFFVNVHAPLGSVLIVNGEENEGYVSAVQHVRRRETIAMTPANCLVALKSLAGLSSSDQGGSEAGANKAVVLELIKEISGAQTKALLGSSGLSVQYAIMMGLIDHALEVHAGKDIKIIVPPNCYGGTNDQARRVAACIDGVEVVDLPVDGDNDMVRSVNIVLDKIADQDAVPYIIAEIPTNPRVEVPDIAQLEKALSKKRKTAAGTAAIDPVFILDQTFCPNVHFLGEGEALATVRTIAYISGSKFPSGGRCTAGYCVANEKAEPLLGKIEKHLRLCDNGATDPQIEVLASQMPSMNQRINAAYRNTREFVNFISETLPEAKINFVSEELASQGFIPSVFSLGLPAKGKTAAEKEAHKRALNHKLIDLMITEIPHESKYCVSYGQLKGCYWTIPATSTQGTTKESDKDYIIRASLSPEMDVELHKEVFARFVREM